MLAPEPVGSSWLPFAALGGGLALLAGLAGWLLLRRRRAPEGAEVEPDAPVAAPPPPVPPPPAPVPPPIAAPRPAPRPPGEAIAVEIVPRRLVLNEVDALLEFELRLASQAETADGLRLGIALVSASPEQDTMLDAYHRGTGNQPPSTAPFTLPPGRVWANGATLVLPRWQIHSVELGGRRMFVPMLMVDLRWRAGLSLRHQAADFMVGTGGQGGKLGPIWLDKREHQGLAASRYFPRPAAMAAGG